MLQLLLKENVILMSDEVVYIFLDIDGVLNNDLARKAHQNNDVRVISNDNLLEFVNLINNIKKEYLIILTSTWRYSIDNINLLKKFLNDYGLLLFDCLDTDQSKSRGKLIIEYCQKRNISFDNILIFDDANISELSSRLIKCDFKLGLTKRETTFALKLLK